MLKQSGTGRFPETAGLGVLLAHRVKLSLDVVWNLCLEARPKYVVDPQHRACGLGGTADGGSNHAERLKHPSRPEVGGDVLFKVQADALGPIRSIGLGSGHIEQRVDWVQTSVFCQGARNNFQGVSESLDGHLLSPRSGFGKAPEVACKVNMARTASDQQAPILAEVRRDAEGIIETAGGFLNNFIAAASCDERRCMTFSAHGPVMKVPKHVRPAFEHASTSVGVQRIHVVEHRCASGESEHVQIVPRHPAEGLDAKVKQAPVRLVVNGS